MSAIKLSSSPLSFDRCVPTANLSNDPSNTCTVGDEGAIAISNASTLPSTPKPADTLEDAAMTDAGSSLTPEQYRKKMERRKAVQQQRLAERDNEKGLIIVHTGKGKGKTTAALGMVLRSLGHGHQVAIVQFIKGAWEPAEKKVFGLWPDQLDFHAMGEGFTWETQDRERDKEMAQSAWEKALDYIQDPGVQLTLLDEVNVALKLGYLSVDQVVRGLQGKPEMSHVILTGRGAPSELIDKADLVTEMTLVKHPFREQGVKAQAGIEY